jgi:hypothetical protein
MLSSILKLVSFAVRFGVFLYMIKSFITGCSVMLSSILKLVPFAVLFGVFLYMGISGMNGVQFFDRLILFFRPVKHHPQVRQNDIILAILITIYLILYYKINLKKLSLKKSLVITDISFIYNH